MNYLEHTQGCKVIVLVIAFMAIGCQPVTVDARIPFSFKMTYINQTTDTIFGDCLDADLPAEILPNDTVVVSRDSDYPTNQPNEKLNLEKVSLSVPCTFSYGQTNKCDPSTSNRERQTNRKQISDNEFEATIFFTEMTKENATDCSPPESK